MRPNYLLPKALTTLLAFFFSVVLCQAQTGTIRGTVKDGNGPVTGASITVSGSSAGTVTDASGNYELKLKPGSYKVTISYVGDQPYSTRVTVQANETVSVDATLSGSGPGEEIVVVGSRSAGRSKLSTPVPVDVITAKELKTYAQMDATQVLTYLAPSFQSSRTVISDGTDHIDPAGLRGLGPDQTLVLVNGKRRHNTALVNINGTVGRGSVGTDLNAIPIAAIERIEVLRDGAAAQYGSDAIAGVINLVLKKNYKGFNISGTAGENVTNLNYGNTKKNIVDGVTRQVDWYAGTNMGKAGAHLVFSGQYLTRDRSNRSGNDNIPLVYIGNSGGGFPATPAGANAGDFRRFLIDKDKEIVSGRNYDRHNIVAGNSKSENLGMFLNGDIPFTSRLNLYYTFGYGHRIGNANGFSRNPNSFSQQPVHSSGDLVYPNGFLPEIHTTIDDLSSIVGVKTNLGRWDLDFSNTAGGNKLGFMIRNTGNASLPGNDFPQTEFDAGHEKFYQNTSNIDLSRKFTKGANIYNLAFGGEYRFERFQIIDGETTSWINGGRKYEAVSTPVYPPTGTSSTYGTGSAAAGSQVFPGFSPSDKLNKRRDIKAGYVDAEANFGQFLLTAAGRYEKYSDFGDGIGGKVSARLEATKNFAIRASANAGFRAPSLQQRYFQNTSTQFVSGQPSNSLTANNDNPIVRNAFGIQSLKPEKSIDFTVGVVGKISNNFTITLDGYLINIKDRIVLSTPFNFTSNNPDPVNFPTPTQKIFRAYGIDPTQVSALQFWTNAVDTRTTGLDAVMNYKFNISKGSMSLSVAANFNKNKVVGDVHANSIIDDPANNPSRADATNNNPAFDLTTLLFDRQQRSRIEVAQPKSKINATLNYSIQKWNMVIRAVRFGESVFLNTIDPNALKADGTNWNDVGPGTDQTFSAKITTDMVLSYRFCEGATVSIGANNIFDVYPDRVFIDPRNDASFVYNNPVQSSLSNSKTSGGYNSGRDASNRGRFLYGTNQFGFNGRFLFARLGVDVGQLKCWKKK